MFTEEKNDTKTISEKDKCLDACILIGQKCWDDYRESENGHSCLELLPSDQVRERANALFQLGFCCRMLVSPSIGLDYATEEKELNRLWVEHLETSGGEIVLDGFPFPYTDEATLRVAKAFFRLGYRAGTLVRQKIEESCRQVS